jgi:putative transposase
VAEQTGNCEFRKSEIPRNTCKRVPKNMRRHAFEACPCAHSIQYPDHTDEMAVTPIGWECEGRTLPSRHGFDTRYCSVSARRGGFAMADLFLLSQAQMRRFKCYFPRSHGVARVDDRRIVSAIVFVIKNGLRWRDAPREYGPHKTIYNRFVRWSRLGVFNKIFAELARPGGKPERIMIDATHLPNGSPTGGHRDRRR